MEISVSLMILEPGTEATNAEGIAQDKTKYAQMILKVSKDSGSLHHNFDKAMRPWGK